VTAEDGERGLIEAAIDVIGAKRLSRATLADIAEHAARVRGLFPRMAPAASVRWAKGLWFDMLLKPGIIDRTEGPATAHDSLAQWLTGGE
jgi:hypothetical protein